MVYLLGRSDFELGRDFAQHSHYRRRLTAEIMSLLTAVRGTVFLSQHSFWVMTKVMATHCFSLSQSAEHAVAELADVLR